MHIQHPRAGEGDGVPPAKVDVNGTTVPVDDGVFEISDEHTGWLDRFAERYEADADSLLVDDASDDGLKGSFDPTDHTVDEVQDHVESIDGSDIVAELKAIRTAEVEGKNRTTALEAIDDRLEAEEAD